VEHLEKAHDLTQKLITSEDSPGQQDRLGVILTIQGEIINETKKATPDDRRRALEKQRMAVVIFCQLEQTTVGMGRDRILCRLVESLFSMADTLENLELHNESQGAMQEAQIIGKRAQLENLPSSLHQHQQIFASTKETMTARKDLYQHTSTLHVGSKICLHGLLSQEMNGKDGTVIGPAVNNRIGIQLHGENRRVSIRILNLRYQKGPGKNRRTLYCKVVEKAQAKFVLLNEGLRAQIRITGNRHVDTAHMRQSLGRALWLSNKPLETTQALDEFQAAISFLKQCEPKHHSLISFEKARDMAQESVTLFKEPGIFGMALLKASYLQMGR